MGKEFLLLWSWILCISFHFVTHILNWNTGKHSKKVIWSVQKKNLTCINWHLICSILETLWQKGIKIIAPHLAGKKKFIQNSISHHLKMVEGLFVEIKQAVWEHSYLLSSQLLPGADGSKIKSWHVHKGQLLCGICMYPDTRKASYSLN